MKLLLTSIIFVFLSVNTSAQFQKGDKFINGNLGLGSSRSTDSNGDVTGKFFEFGIGPTIGLFATNSLAIGQGFSYGYSRSESGANSNVSLTKSISGNFVIKKYFNLSDNLAFSLTSYLRGSRYRYKDGDIESKALGVGMSIQPGLVFLLNQNWGIDCNLGSIGYNFYRNTTYKSNTTNFGVNAGAINFGCTYYFRN